MKESNGRRFDDAASGVCENIRCHLRALPDGIKSRAQEIRLRVNRPVAIGGPGAVRFLRPGGGLAASGDAGCVCASKSDLEETFRVLCGNSVYSHEAELRNGYVTLCGGHRAGICGTTVFQSGKISGIREVSSVNIRIAREVPGCADVLLGKLGGAFCGGLLLVGPPSSGKTTILRDIARQLSNGLSGTVRKVAVVDERGEIAGTFRGIPQNDVGLCCDVLDGCPKAEGILTAVRTLSPQYIVCDEIGTEEEVRAVEQSLNAGVCVVASIHAGSLEELRRRRQAAELLKTGAFAAVALLRGSGTPGEIAKICGVGDFLAETCGGIAADRRGIPCGIYGIA